MVGHLHIGLIIAATAFLANAIAGNGSVTSAFLRGITVSCETNSLDRAVPRMDASFAEIGRVQGSHRRLYPAADDLDEAVEIAKESPLLEIYGVSIEVRPVNA